MHDFSKQADLRQFKSKEDSSKQANATVDINMVFTPK